MHGRISQLSRTGTRSDPKVQIQASKYITLGSSTIYLPK